MTHNYHLVYVIPDEIIKPDPFLRDNKLQSNRYDVKSFVKVSISDEFQMSCCVGPWMSLFSISRGK